MIRLGARVYRFLGGDSIEGEYREEMYNLTIKDALTNAYTRRYLTDTLNRLLSFAEGAPLRFTLLGFEVEGLINESESLLPVNRDDLVSDFVELLKPEFDRQEVLARLEADVFVAVLPGKGIEETKSLAARLLDRVMQYTYRNGDQAFSVSIALGAESVSENAHSSAIELIKGVGRLIQEAKRQGKNQFCCANVGELEKGFADNR